MGQESMLTSSIKAAWMLSRQRAQGEVITLKRLQEGSQGVASNEEEHPSLTGAAKKRGRFSAESSDDEQNLVKALRQKPWINYNDLGTNSEDIPDNKQVSARWHPEGSCRPSLEEAPVFFPLEEEFKDTLRYIASISAEVEPYGICRIVPPQSWRPPCPLRDTEKRETSTFLTRVQQIHKLQVRKTATKRYPRMRRRKKGRPSRMDKHVLDANGEVLCEGVDENDMFGFEPGPDLTIAAFEKYANEFQEEYFGMGNLNEGIKGASKKRRQPSVEEIEGEYWRIIENATEELEVLYGADIETSKFGSGFPKAKGVEPNEYENSGWNLNNIARLPGSCLAFEEGDISGVLIPWLYVGMCFSSFCWHVEDHQFYSLNYMHWGSPKVWYGVPSSAATKLEEAMKKHLPDLFEEQPDLLHKLVTQISPSLLRKEGIPVYRAVQRAGEFIVTFPRAYHAGFNCGFNCAEAVNLAPVDWLPYGQSAVEVYREQCRKTSVSHDKLLLCAATQALRAHPQLSMMDTKRRLECYRQYDVLTKALKIRVEMERARRAPLMELIKVTIKGSNIDASIERECFQCHYDLHLSAIGCHCCPQRFACLYHAESLCACGWESKYALYRHDISELESLLLDVEEGFAQAESWLSKSCTKLSPNVSVLASPKILVSPKTEDLSSLKGEGQSRGQKSHVGLSSLVSNSEIKANIINEQVTKRVVGSRDDDIVEVEWSTSRQIAIQGSTSKIVKEKRKPNLDLTQSTESISDFPSTSSQMKNASYQVELLNIGRLVPRKSWYTKYAIFPAGFKSHVLFNSYLDPLQMQFYTSEVLDFGQPEPLFKVALENQPSEAILDNSIDKCWETVQERVNKALQKLQTDGQPKEYIQGIDLAGFTKPEISKAIESLDWQHQCLEYWAGRQSAVELLNSQHVICVENRKALEISDDNDEQLGGEKKKKKKKKRAERGGCDEAKGNLTLYDTLRGLFMKATTEELFTLHQLFSYEWGGEEWKEGFAALKDELQAFVP